MGTLALPHSHLDAVSPFPPFPPSAPSLPARSGLPVFSGSFGHTRFEQRDEGGREWPRVGRRREREHVREISTCARPPAPSLQAQRGRSTHLQNLRLTNDHGSASASQPLRYLEETRWKRVEREQTHRDPLLLLHHHTTTPSPASLILRDLTRKKP